MTSRLVHGLELADETRDGIQLEFTVVDGIGPGAAERRLGADVLGVVRIELGGVRLARGFLAQSKRSEADGLRLHPAADEAYSHWLYRGDDIQLEKSGIVSVTRPTPQLDEQCENMLRATPSAFVLVFGDSQIAVVSAAAVHAHRPSRPRLWKDLGTKRLDDFFVHLVDGFIGDPTLGAASVSDLQALAERRGASSAMMLRVSDQNST